MFKTQNTEYDYIYVENHIYKKLKEAVKICKNQTKDHSVLAKMYKLYIICTPKCDAVKNRFCPLLSSMFIVFASFGNLVNVFRDYQLIYVGSSS